MERRRQSRIVLREAVLLAYFFWSFFSPPALGRTEPPIKDLPCRSQIDLYLNHWEKHQNWKREPVSLNGDTVYRTPTSQIGVWLEMHVSLAGALKAIRIAPEGIAYAIWQPDSCQRQSSLVPARYDRERMENSFSDYQFRKIVQTNTAGVVYAWSPHMPLSLASLQEVKRAAAKLNLKVFPVLDPDADPQSASDAAKRHNLEPSALMRMESIELFQRGMAIHFPSVVVFAGGRIRGDVIPGAKVEAIYVKLIGRELAKQ